MLDFMKPMPHLPVTKTQAEVDKAYREGRMRVFIGMWIGYAMFYFTRNSYKSIMPLMLEDLNFTRTDVGFLSTIFYIVYGSSRFIGGIMSDHSNPKFFMGIGLIASGILNIVFGLSSSLMMFGFIWALNAFFQGWGWPPCTKIMTTWYSRNERGFWWAATNTSHNVGGAIIPILAGAVAMQFGWRYGMIVPGIIGIVSGALIILVLTDRPESRGLPPVGVWRNDELEKEQVKSSKSGLSTWQILNKYIFTNVYIWLLAISYVMVYIVRIGINDWTNLYLIETRGLDLVVANSAITMLEIGGFIGTIVAGWGSDKLFKGNRVPMNIIFMVGITVSVVLIYLAPVTTLASLGAVYFFVGFFIFGPQMLTGMAAAEHAHKDAAGTATGFIGLFGYLGAALTGAPLARIIDTSGWDFFFIVIIVASILSAVLIIPILKPKKLPTVD